MIVFLIILDSTPEFKALLEQLGVFGCRVVDAAALGKNKTLIHDVYDLIWSGVELANDPATTVAMAEVAAYLCHALEMEDAAIYAIAKEREEINRKAAQERQERDHYQKSTYQDSYLFSDPNATVEEVILSAIGVIQKSVEEAQQNHGELNNDIPGSVVVGSEDDDESTRPSRAASPPPPERGVTGTKPEHDEGEEEGTDNDRQETDGIQNQDIDVGYLRERITKRAETTQQRRLSSFKIEPTSGFKNDPGCVPSSIINRKQPLKTTEDGVDDGKKDIEDLASIVRAGTPKKRTKSLNFEDATESQHDNLLDEQDDVLEETNPAFPGCLDRVEPLEGEAPVAHFYRVLDQVLTNQRKQSVKSAVDKNSAAELEALVDQNPEAAGLKKHLQSLRSEKRVGKTRNAGSLTVRIERMILENQVVVCASVLLLLCLAVVFFGFGCYGMYVFLFPSALSPVMVPGGQKLAGSEIHIPLVIHDDTQSQRKNEYVIRVVREVVHVNGQGETLRVHTEQSDEL